MATQEHVSADTRLVTFIGQFVVDRHTELTEVADPLRTTYQPIIGKVASLLALLPCFHSMDMRVGPSPSP